ncbi:hypothetical protein FDI38_gp061 [Streptomyces phage Peebs]|uniref:Uncharacterized protein n=1 Tax=Streptomyces phage Peebs TaxID=2023994 RepID=A0A222Z2T9_9CAUD|nr:hypothetical protein FDI38_gp061 [Streptomyces phage Peebs]ASR77905.1 hypothetical protein SEA_PEEBS_246 [Streptomyces phage Peebs]
MTKTGKIGTTRTGQMMAGPFRFYRGGIRGRIS